MVCEQYEERGAGECRYFDVKDYPIGVSRYCEYFDKDVYDLKDKECPCRPRYAGEFRVRDGGRKDA